MPADRAQLKYGQSITDACVGWDETERLLVAAKVQFVPELSAEQVAQSADEAERLFVAHHPGIQQVFIDPTPSLQHRVPPD